MAYRRRYRKRNFHGRKRTYRRRMYRARRFRRRVPYRRRSYRNKLWTRKNQLGARMMLKYDGATAWKCGGSHMMFRITTPTLTTGTTSYWTRLELTNPFTQSSNCFPTGMKEMSIRYSEYRCNGGKISLKILNEHLFGCTIYHKFVRLGPDTSQVDEQAEFLDMEENDLDHAHGVAKTYLPPAVVLNDGTTIKAGVKKLIQRWRTRDLIKGISTMADQWRIFTYPASPAWNTAATGCSPIKNSNSNWSSTQLVWCARYVADRCSAGNAKWTNHTFDAGHRLFNHTWKVRSYCQYRKPREMEPNNANEVMTQCTGGTDHDPFTFEDPA